MAHFIQTIFQRSFALGALGAVHFLAFVIFLALMYFDNRVLMGVNVWLKPMKFAVSIGIFLWTMAWIVGYLAESPTKTLAIWLMVSTMIIEMVCIAGQAGRGVLSHFNIQTPMDGAIFNIMAIAIGVNTIAVGMIAWLFFQESFIAGITLEPAYIWAIRLSFGIFIVASLQGYLMGARLQHSVGAPDGTLGLPLLNWSRSVGDLRVAHFIGLHAIQILPLFGFFLAQRLSSQNALFAVIALALVYGGVCILALLQALAGVPFLKSLG
jgi:hypothetical protein